MTDLILMTSRVTVDREQFGDALAMERQMDLAALGPAHPLDRVGQRHALGEVVIDLDDLIAGLDPGLVGGSVLDRRDDGQHAVLDGDFDAEAAEAAARFDFEVVIQLGRQIGAMRVERGQHPGDSAVDEVLGGDRLDVVFLHDREHVGEGFQLLVGVVGSACARCTADFLEHHEAGYQAEPRA